MTRGARLLSSALLGVMVVQSSTGLLFQAAYRDVDWMRATWFGNNWVTLLVAVPLLFMGSVHAARGSVRGLLVWLGAIGYAAYNYAFYLFGAALNAFFPMYVVGLLLAVSLLILVLSSIDAPRAADMFRPAVPVRLIGGSLVIIGVGLASVWIGMWAAYVFAGRPTLVDPDAFRLVAALDLTSMVPALTVGGVLLWRGRRWGVVVAAIASIQGALYLFVLSINSIVLIRRGLANAPGELPIWGTLTIVTATLALLLFANTCDWRARKDSNLRPPA